MSLNIHSLPQNQPPPRTGQAFLHRLHGGGWKDIWVACSGSLKDWHGGRAGPTLLTSFPVSAGHYYSIAHIRPGATTRSEATFESLWAIVLDDVGTGAGSNVDLSEHRMLLPEPTAIIETSEQNFQWVYKLVTPEPDLDKVKAALAALKVHPILARAFEGTADAVHYFRLPGGVNPKKDRDNSFSTVCREFDLANVHEFDDLMQAFGVDMAAAIIATPARGASTPKTYTQAPAKVLRKFMQRFPNQDPTYRDRPPWTGVCHAIASSTLNEPDEGREIWIDWSSRQIAVDGTPIKPVPGKAEHVWDTLGDDHDTTIEILIGRLEAQFPLYKDRVFDAEAGFTEEVDVERVSAAIKDVKRDLPPAGDLLKLLHATRTLPVSYNEPIPGSMSGWTQIGVPMSAAAAPSFPLRPQILGGLLRGSVSMLSGSPGGGKSALSLLIASAIAHENPAIAGFPNLKLPGAVVIVSNEDPQEEVKRRLAAIDIKHGLGAPLHPVVVASGSLLRRTDNGDFVGSAEGVTFLKNMIALRKAHDTALIVIDTLITIAEGADENSANDMQAIMRFLNRLAWAAWASVLVLHHPPKSAWDNDVLKRSLASIRGSSAIAGSLRSSYALSSPTLEEQKAFGWTTGQVKDIAVLEVAKGSWLRAGVKAFYEKGAVGLPSFDPFNPGAAIPDEETLVLNPITPLAPSTGSLIQKALATLRAHPRVVRWKRKAERASRHPDDFENVMGLDRKKAEEVMGMLEKFGKIAINKQRIGSNPVEIVVVIEGSGDEWEEADVIA